MLKVELDIFSGRENPTWILDEDESREILTQIADNRGVVDTQDSGFDGLGYRGLVLEVSDDTLSEDFGLPTEFKIAGGAGDFSKGMAIAKQLVEGHREDLKKVVFEGDFISEVLQEMEAFESLRAKISEGSIETTEDGAREKGEGGDDEEAAPRICCRIERGRFNPGFWNNDANVRRNNNCYNYGRNWRTNTFAQPGRASGDYPNPMQCGEVSQAALHDGAHRRYDCFPDTERPRWVMALVVGPGWDYHWYRWQCEGFWGHKPGGTAAKNTDNSGRVIWNPQTCDRGRYTDFCGYFYACRSMRIR